jgi:SGNH hydrolase-like domain, acetyltransferase AlgX
MDRLFVGILAAVLLLPLVQMAFGVVPLDPLNEKRKRFEIPDLWSRLGHADPTLASDINRWFDDHYGFRDLLIRTKNQIDYSLFGTSHRLAIGKDGWLFLREHDNAMVQIERDGDLWHEDLESKLLTIARFLNDRGIRFIVIGVPDKGDVHPEFRGGENTSRPHVTQFDKLAQKLAGRPEVTYLDAGRILRDLDDRRDRYWRTDIHYTFGAARAIVRTLVRTIAEFEGRPPHPEPKEFVEQDYPFSGDLAAFLATFIPALEVSYQYVDPFVADRDTPDGHWEKDARRVEVPGLGPMPPFDFIYRSTPEAAQGKLPTTVLFGNSFADMYFNVGIHTYFTSFYRARNISDRFDKSLRNLPEGTKYVVLQFFAPFVGGEMGEWNLRELDPVDRPNRPFPIDSKPAGPAR